MKKLAVVYGGASHHYTSIHTQKYRPYFAEIIYLLDLPHTELRHFDGLLVPDRTAWAPLHAAMPRIDELLQEGKTVISFGEQPRPWLPGVEWEFRPTNFWWWLDPNARSGLELAQPEHAMFNYLTLEDATWHQHGIFRPPAGAETLIARENDGAVLYLDRVSSPGTMLITSLDPMAHLGSYFMAATERFLDGFLPWVTEELL
jgi:hypothetical protein